MKSIIIGFILSLFLLSGCVTMEMTEGPAEGQIYRVYHSFGSATNVDLCEASANGEMKCRSVKVTIK